MAITSDWKDVEHLEFYADGARVCFKNSFFLIGDESREEAPIGILVVCNSIEGNYGVVMDAEVVAQKMAELLNS